MIFTFSDIKQRIARPSIVYNYRRFLRVAVRGKVLLYYKTDPFGLSGYLYGHKHVNNAEVTMMVRALNSLGFSVDIIDRTTSIQQLIFADEYVLFIGIGAGDSGKYFAHIAKQVPSAKKIFYALGPEPTYSNELIEKRYSYFYQRYPQYRNLVRLRRTITAVDIGEVMDFTDIILCCGNGFASDTYKKFAKPIYNIYPSTSSGADFPPIMIYKDPLHFLYFGGNGNIVKGLDIVCDVFRDLPEKFKLTVCAPTTEKDFNYVFTEQWGQCKNISFPGFIKIGGNDYVNLVQRASYVIFPSCSEGFATSVGTCLRSGLVPIVTKESGIDMAKEIGNELESSQVEYIRGVVRSKEFVSMEDLAQQSARVYAASGVLTQSSFYHQFISFCLSILN